MTTQQMSSIHADFVSLGLAPEVASTLMSALEAGIESGDLESAWRSISKTILQPDQPFEVHLKAHAALFANWDMATRPAPVWSPDRDEIDATNLAALMGDEEIDDYESLHRWSVEDVAGFWAELIDRLGIHFMTKPNRVIADDADVRTPDWLPGAMLNISDSCFNANADAPAIIHAREDGTLNTMSYAKLDALTSRVANGLVEAGLEPGDAIAIDMLMTVESVAIYLGIVRAGCVAVSIADSFAPDEIATRLRLANAKAIFTQDVILRAGKQLPLYEKVCAADAPLAIVLPADENLKFELREGDQSWLDFLSKNDAFDAIPCTPAAGVFSNPTHAATAPQRMTAAGVADFLSKCSSTTDWRASHILLDVPFDASVRRFYEGIQELLIERAPDVGRAEPGAVGLVLEALLLSGFAMVAAGSSSPASGGEHLISHYIDMKAALNGLPHDLHGAQVGVATIYCLGLWGRILVLEAREIDVDQLVDRQPSDEQVRQWIEEDWGPVSPVVQEQWDAKKMDPAALRRHLETFKASVPRLRDELPTDLLPTAVVRRAIQVSGGPVEPEELQSPLFEYRRGRERGRYIRNRFTVLDLAVDLVYEEL